jgi:predicted small integral membrane protein
MDTIFPESGLRWRAITDPALQTAAYWLIIVWEALTAIVLWFGVARLIGAVATPAFGRAKTGAIIGLTMGFLLYGPGFVVIGAEWFAMWQSNKWNAQPTAYEFVGMICTVLVILLIPEPSED